VNLNVSPHHDVLVNNNKYSNAYTTDVTTIGFGLYNTYVIIGNKGLAVAL
jgi:hypothetical protein